MTHRTRAAVVAAVIAGGFTVGVGTSLFLSQRQIPFVQAPVWDVSELTIPQQMHEFDTLQGTVTLRNLGKSTIECREIGTRFEFTELLAADGTPLQFPHTIAAHSSQKYMIRAEPRDYYGALHEQITAVVGIGAGSASATFDLSTSVLPAWRAFPRAAVVGRRRDGSVSDAVIDVYDAFEGDGITVANIEVSDARLLAATIEKRPTAYNREPSARSIAIEPSVVKIPPSIWKYRFSIRLRRPSEPSSRSKYGFVRVIAAGNSKIPPLTIRVAVE